MKLKIIVLMLCGVAGAGASYAFASGGGDSQGQSSHCRRNVVFGTVAAPQSFTVTVTHSWGHHNGPAAGTTLNVTLGSSGQTVRFSGEGCVGTDGTLTVRSAELHAVTPHTGNGNGDGDHNGGTSTTTSTTGTTTTDNSGTTTTTSSTH